jgi:hypothetical protein
MNPTVTTHELSLGLDKNGKYVEANPNFVSASKGEKFSAKSDQGSYRVVFEPWPFQETRAKDTVDTDDELTFERLGEFEFYCYLTPTGSTSELGYPGNSGGRGIVRP